MQQCPNGHLYDDEKNVSCPYCSNDNSINVTVPLSDPQPQMQGFNAFPQTIPLDASYVVPQPEVVGADSGFPQTAPVSEQFGVTQYKDDAVNDKGIVEIRGWLVCLEGEKCGEDFRIRGERSNIGRGDKNDIKLDFDNAISKGINAIISYDTRSNKFFIYLGESKNNIYVNNQLLMTPIELKDYDIIEIGNTKLIFRSLCNERFNWTREAKNDDKK